MKHNKKGIMAALPIVASAYAEKFNVPVHLGGSAAYTDGVKIVMPDALKDNFPMDVAWGYLAHEAAHIKWSDFGFVGDTPFEHGLINALEDCRIERAMIDTYPGTFYTLQALDKHLIDDDRHNVPSISNPGAIVQAVCLYWGMHNVVCKSCFDGLLKDSIYVLRGALGDFVTDQILGLLHERMKQASSTADIKSLAKDIIAVLKQAADTHDAGNDDIQNQLGSSNNADGSDDANTQGEAKCSPDSSSANADKSDATGNGAGQAQGDANEDIDIQTNPISLNNQNAAKAALGTVDDGSLLDTPQGLKDRASMIRENINNAVAADLVSSAPICYSDAQRIGSNSNNGVLVAAKADKIASRMQRELLGLVQSKARIAPVAKRIGKHIDCNRFLRVLSGDTRVFRSASERVSPNTAVHILIDTSGSMSGGRIKVVVPAAYAIAKSLGSIRGVNPAVTAFAQRHDSLLQVVMSHGQKAIACKDRFAAISAGGFTPLAQAIVYASLQLSKTKESRKIIFCLTDGEPSYPAESKKAIELAQESGIEVFGIGIMTNAIDQFFNRRIHINNLDELPKKLFALVGNEILASVAA